MKFEVEATPNFKKEAKRLLKKFPSLKQEISELISSLEINPEQGTPLGNNLYKIRLAISSKGKGKSGGACVITFVAVSETTVLLLSIYNKGEQDSISLAEIKAIIQKYN